MSIDTCAVKISCHNCRDYKMRRCNGFGNPHSCSDYIYLPSISEEEKNSYPGSWDDSWARAKETMRHGER